MVGFTEQLWYYTPVLDAVSNHYEYNPNADNLLITSYGATAQTSDA